MNLSKRFLGICFSLLMIISVGFAQDRQKIDSLKNQLAIVKNDSLKTRVLFTLTWEYIKTRTLLDSARYFSDQAMDICTSKKDESGIATVHSYRGIIHRVASNYQEALLELDSALQYYEQKSDSFRMANTLFHVAVIKSYQGKYDESLNSYLRILKIYEAKNDQYGQATILNSIGIIYKELKKYELALESYEKSLALFLKLDEKKDIELCYGNIGGVYEENEQFEFALENYQKAYEISLQINDEPGRAYQLVNLASILGKLERYSEALEYNREAVELNRQIGHKKEIGIALLSLGDNYLRIGEFTLAKQTLLEAISMSSEIGANKDLAKGHYLLAETLEKSGEYKYALSEIKKYHQIQDSLLNETNLEQINELQTRYETEKKQSEIELLTKDQALKKAELSKERSWRQILIVIMIMLVAFIIFILIIYKQRLKSTEVINKKNDEINRQKIKELEKNQKLYALDAMITGQEKERMRIAQDLHDGLGVLLTNVQNNFSSIQSEINKVKKLDVYNRANTLLDEACNEVRKIAHNMMPGTLMKLGLVPAIKDLCDGMIANTDLNIEFHVFGIDKRLDESIEITIYRIVQEALNNILKYAKAKEVLIQISKNDENINITIEDDGIGFNLIEAQKKKGMGLKNLESRVKYLNGILEIESEKGKGTSINIDIPYNQHNKTSP